MLEAQYQEAQSTLKTLGLARDKAARRLLVSDLRSNQDNKISIEPDDLPASASATRTETVAAPSRRSGTRIDFGIANVADAAIVILRDSSGRLLPPGSSGQLEGGGTFVVGYDGQAYISGLEAYAADQNADLSRVASVGSFFVSRVDTEVDRRLEAIGTEQALALRGRAAVAQAQLAYKLFTETFRGARWDKLAARGARVQRPLWASTGTKNKAYSDVLYVEELIGPDTVNTLTEATIEAFEDHGELRRTVDADIAEAERVWAQLAEVGVDMDDVSARLEREGVDAFAKSFDELIAALQAKVDELRSR